MKVHLELETYEKRDVSVIRMNGDVTALSGGVIEEAYQNLSAEGAKKILLRFDQSGYIDSGGIAILIGIASKSRQRGQEIRFTGLSSHFKAIFQMIGLTKYTKIYPSEDVALEGF